MAFHDHLDDYLNDHVAGSALAIDLARQSVRRNQGRPIASYLEGLVLDIEEDRATLERIMERIGGDRSELKHATGWLAEKASRLKFDAPIGVDDEVNRVLEMEALLMGIHGKQAMWEALERLVPVVPALGGFDFRELADRAGEQIAEVNGMRLEMVSPTR